MKTSHIVIGAAAAGVAYFVVIKPRLAAAASGPTVGGAVGGVIDNIKTIWDTFKPRKQADAAAEAGGGAPLRFWQEWLKVPDGVGALAASPNLAVPVRTSDAGSAISDGRGVLGGASFVAPDDSKNLTRGARYMSGYVQGPYSNPVAPGFRH